MTLLDSRGRFLSGSLVVAYCPKCQKSTRHHIYLDDDGIDETLVCAVCSKQGPVPEEFRMRELGQPTLYELQT